MFRSMKSKKCMVATRKFLKMFKACLIFVFFA